LLSIDDEAGVSLGSGETAEAAVPGGSTIMEMPAFSPTGEPIEQTAATETQVEDKKAAAAKKNAPGAAQDAAKALLEKLKQGKRK
jgi:hypothetical protein